MNQEQTLSEPTTSAATRETEPEVVAGIASGEIGPDVPTSVTTNAGSGFGFGMLALLLAGGIAIGYATSRLLQRD
jgi:hypothetical protein